MNKQQLWAHLGESYYNRDKWQNEINATIQAFQNFKEPILTPAQAEDLTIEKKESENN
jgi:predicted Zn-dependent protease